jgi:septum formation protein
MPYVVYSSMSTFRESETVNRTGILPGACMSLVLASASPRRKKLLHQLGFELKIDPSSVEEIFDESMEPSIMARNLASLKAEEVSRRHPTQIVLGADTIVVLDGLMLAKPSDPDDAKAMLRLLSGRIHHVWTGVSLIRLATDSNISFAECTEVQFAALSDHEIDAYVATGSPLDKAGAYGIQDDWGAVFISGINGDYYNVVGLPLHAMYRNLLKFA